MIHPKEQAESYLQWIQQNKKEGKLRVYKEMDELVKDFSSNYLESIVKEKVRLPDIAAQ